MASPARPFRGQKRPEGGEIPVCACGIPVSMRVTKKDDTNQGRWFFTCTPGSCKFFEWCDSKAKSPHRAGAPQPAHQPAPTGSTHVVHLTRCEEAGRLGVCFPYDVPALGVIQSFKPDARWFPIEKEWRTSASNEEALVERFADLRDGGGRWRVTRPPRFVHALMNTPPTRLGDAEVSSRLASVPASVTALFKKHQKDGLAMLVQRAGRALLADGMGLGKTAQAVATAVAFASDWPLLVIAPAGVARTWAEELNKWLPSGFASVVMLKTGSDAPRALANVPPGGRRAVIVSYDLVSALPRDTYFPFVIADEAHMLKTPDAQRTKACLPRLQSARRALLLTGTPMLNRPAEMWTQLQALLPKTLAPSWDDYTQRYCSPKPSKLPGVRWDVSGSSCLGELNLLLRRTIFIRRTKEEIADQLPAKSRACVPLDITDAELAPVKAHRALIDAASDDEARALMAKYHVLSGRAKVNAVKEHVAALLELKDPPVKVLLFAHHTAVMDALASGLTVDKVSFVRIDGSVSHNARTAAVAAFQSSSESSPRVALLSIHAAGVGITLTAASRVVFAELAWTPGLLRQAEDRAHRLGQARQVAVEYLIGDGTIDDMMWPTLEAKLGVTGAATAAAAGADAKAEAEAMDALWREARGRSGGGGGGGGGTAEKKRQPVAAAAAAAAAPSPLYEISDSDDDDTATPAAAAQSSAASKRARESTGGGGSQPERRETSQQKPRRLMFSGDTAEDAITLDA